jgi:hypothetical protein
LSSHILEITLRASAQAGRVFVVVLLVLLATAAVIAFVLIHSSQVRSSPVVQKVLWRVSGRNSTTADIGDEVEAHVVVKAEEEYVGSMVVKLRKDVSFWSDSDYSTKTVPVDLKGGEATELELDFVPNEASSGSLRGYFVEVDFTLTHTNWVMENSYPPRLKVLQP